MTSYTIDLDHATVIRGMLERLDQSLHAAHAALYPDEFEALADALRATIPPPVPLEHCAGCQGYVAAACEATIRSEDTGREFVPIECPLCDGWRVGEA